MKKLHYIGYCFADGESGNYQCNVASNLKMHYIVGAAKRAGYETILYSLCKTTKKFQKGIKLECSEGTMHHIASFGHNSILFRLLNLFLFYFQLIVYILFQVRKDDDVLLYHSVRVTKIVSKLLKLKKSRFILEVEEIYACSAEGVQNYYQQEIRNILKFKYFIFVNDFLPQHLKVESDKYIVVYGVYSVAIKEVPPFDDDKIHVLYAGAIETLNKGAFTAIEVAGYLPDNYKMHILGKGVDGDVQVAKKRIQEINDQFGKEKIRYEGFYSGEELDGFMCKCQIGIGTYKIKDNYSNFIFPSKLLSYMCHNLKVVTGRSVCYERADISQDWFLYDTDEYETIARAIVEAGESRRAVDSSLLIQQLDTRLVTSFENMLQERIWVK